MATSLDWQLEPTLIEKVLTLAQQQGRSPEAILTEAVTQYLETQMGEGDRSSDPLIGLFEGSSDLAARSEEILQQEITKTSGWTWKQPLP